MEGRVVGGWGGRCWGWGRGKGGGEGSGREGKKRDVMSEEGIFVGYTTEGQGKRRNLYIMNRGRRVLEYAGYMLIVFVTAGVNILANDKIKKNAFIIR